MKTIGTIARDWLRLPDQYDRFTRYLRDNGLTNVTRALLGLIVCGLGLCALLNRFSTVGPQSSAALIANTVVVGSCFFVGIMWWIFGPTKRRSFAFVVFCDIAVAISILGDSEALARLLCSVIFSLVATYIAFFHNPKLQIAHIAFSMTMIFIGAHPILIGPDRDVVLGLSKVLVVITSLLCAALICQIMLTMLSMDASSSDLDPLTGLLNRRGLDRHIEKLFADFATPDSTAVLVIAMDIDNFKTINDVHGHDVGDRIILRVAQRLSSWARSDAVVARIGGDEFVVVQRLAVTAIGSVLDSIGPAMHNNFEDIRSTTSIGIAVRTHGLAPNEPSATAFADMQKVADSAMYESKRLGGGRVHTIITTQPRNR